MNMSDILKWGVIAGIAYFLYQKFQTNIAAPTANFIADLWLSLTLPAYMVLQGNVKLPNGVLLPLQNADVREYPEGSGKVYLNLGGTFYQLQPSDTDGNWPAVLLS